MCQKGHPRWVYTDALFTHSRPCLVLVSSSKQWVSFAYIIGWHFCGFSRGRYEVIMIIFIVLWYLLSGHPPVVTGWYQSWVLGYCQRRNRQLYSNYSTVDPTKVLSLGLPAGFNHRALSFGVDYHLERKYTGAPILCGFPPELIIQTFGYYNTSAPKWFRMCKSHRWLSLNADRKSCSIDAYNSYSSQSIKYNGLVRAAVLCCYYSVLCIPCVYMRLDLLVSCIGKVWP